MNHKRLARHLKKARAQTGLTLRQVSKRSKGGVSNPYLSQLENGHCLNPSPSKLMSICKILKINYLQTMQIAGYLTSKDLENTNA